MANEQRLDLIDRRKVYENACAGCIRHGEKPGECYHDEPCEHLIFEFTVAEPVDAVEVVHIEKAKQEILQTLDTLIATHRDISNSRFANSEKYLDIPENSNDYYGIYAQAMEVARRLVNAALTDLCDNCGAKMDGGDEGGK